jgi:hypothetical protein
MRVRGAKKVRSALHAKGRDGKPRAGRKPRASQPGSLGQKSQTAAADIAATRDQEPDATVRDLPSRELHANLVSARDKHLSDLAAYLQSAPYADRDEIDTRKADVAYRDVQAYLARLPAENPDSPMVEALRAIEADRVANESAAEADATNTTNTWRTVN